MTLSANATIEHFIDDTLVRHDVKAAVRIYRNAYVGKDPAGNVGPFIPGDEFVGIAYEESNNTDGTAGQDPEASHPANLTKNGKVLVHQKDDWVMALTGVTKIDIGKPVFATADDTVTLSAANPRGFVGYLTGVHATSEGIVRLKSPGEWCDKQKLPNGALHAGGRIMPFAGTGAVAGPASVQDIYADAVLGLGVEPNGVANGARLEFDATSEAAFATLETPVGLDPANGIYLRAEVDLDTWAGTACDIDIGVTDTLTDTERADFGGGDTSRASFHLDGNVLNILCQSDDKTTDVTVVDSTIDAAAFDVYEVIVRAAGTVEFYVNHVRVLASTAFQILAASDHAACLILEKTSGTNTAVVDAVTFEAAGAA